MTSDRLDLIHSKVFLSLLQPGILEYFFSYVYLLYWIHNAKYNCHGPDRKEPEPTERLGKHLERHLTNKALVGG